MLQSYQSKWISEADLAQIIYTEMQKIKDILCIAKTQQFSIQ